VREPSLNPSLLSRISTTLRPDWARTVLARRIAAGGLVLLAAVATLRPDPDGDRADVLVATRDLSPGTALAAADVRSEKRLATTIPDGSQADANAVVGAMLAAPARRGEIITDVRLLGSRLADAAAGPGARIVPLHLADGALVDIVRTGDVVDILAAPDDPQAVSRVLATDAIVVLVSAKQKLQTSENGRLVLVALPARLANSVAGSALGQTVTLTLH
jgi:Flp pilus assembly protein CpaB